MHKKMMIIDFANQLDDYYLRIEHNEEDEETNWNEFAQMHLVFRQRYSALKS
jgi:hypothetical protein